MKTCASVLRVSSVQNFFAFFGKMNYRYRRAFRQTVFIQQLYRNRNRSFWLYFCSVQIKPNFKKRFHTGILVCRYLFVFGFAFLIIRLIIFRRYLLGNQAGIRGNIGFFIIRRRYNIRVALTSLCNKFSVVCQRRFRSLRIGKFLRLLRSLCLFHFCRRFGLCRLLRNRKFFRFRSRYIRHNRFDNFKTVRTMRVLL